MRSASVAVAAGLLLSCRGSHNGGDSGAGPDAGDANAVVAEVVDAAPPPDEAVPQSPAGELTERAKHLLEAISRDDPQEASDIVFPRDGWIATRDAPDPGKEWERRVAGPFRRAVHALSHHRAEYEKAPFISLEIGSTMLQETPRRHSWRKPLWTARGSRLTFIVDGRTRTLRLREMTAWRGAWYVTRLR
jgi:hypothetical protein